MMEEKSESMTNHNESKANGMDKVFYHGITGMMLIAFVESEKLNWKQKIILMEAIRMTTTPLTAEEGLGRLEAIATSLEGASEQVCRELFKPASKCSDSEKRMILQFCINMAIEDQKLSEGETNLILKIADWIDINLINRNMVVDDTLRAFGGEDNGNSEILGLEKLKRIGSA